MALSPGSVVADRYRLTRLVGEGGMGDVWEATHVVTGRSVAIKRLRAAFDARPESRARARFLLEAQAACAVEHPNVVEILDFAEVNGEPPIIVMELLRGETLAQKLDRDAALSVEETARLLLPVASAVGTAHSRSIIHRDLKPANVFLEHAGNATVVKVLDFGIAKWASGKPGDGSLRTETGSTLGTPCYMAPEQALGERVIDHRADIWSLGVILYECLSGSRPVEGENAARIMVRLMQSGIIPIERLVPGLPGELSALVGRMLARKPEFRPRDLREVTEVLGTLTSERAPSFDEPRIELAPPSAKSESTPDASTPPVAWGPETPPVRPAGTPRHPSANESRKIRNWAILGVLATLGTAVVAKGWLRPTNRAIETADRHAPRPAALRSESAALPPPPATSGAAELPRPAPAKRPSPTRKQQALVATSAVAPNPPAEGLPIGTACERSRDCASRVCLAFTCQ